MDWVEISVSTTAIGADLVSGALMEAGARGTQIIDRADVPDPQQQAGSWVLVDPALKASMPEDVIVKAWFSSPEEALAARAAAAGLRRRPGADLGALSLTGSTVREEDWAESWKRFYKPFRLGSRLVVKPSWESWEASPDDLVIELDPGMAFGTGTHESTALCMELMEAHRPQGDVLDVGTGSGILAIAAARLGAARVLAIDIDPVAVQVAGDNVRINGLADRVSVRRGDLLAGIGERFDFACANILAGVIIQLAEPLKRHLRPGAVFLSSGIIRDREDEVAAALAQAGYRVIDVARRGEWVAFAARLDEGGNA